LILHFLELLEVELAVEEHGIEAFKLRFERREFRPKGINPLLGIRSTLRFPIPSPSRKTCPSSRRETIYLFPRCTN
jgi:hypothetical protein